SLAETRAAQRAALEQVEADEADQARHYATRMAHRAELARLWERERSGFVEMELAGTALIGQVRAARELDDAVRLRDVLLSTRQLLEDGVLFVPAAELLLRETRRCDERVQGLVDARVAARLVGRNLTDARRLVAATILTVEAEIDPQLTTERLENARKNSRVWISPDADGMTAIGAVLDCIVGRRWSLDFEALVAAQRTLDLRDGLQRSLDELRAHVFATLPSLVLELCRAARTGELTTLAEVAELDPQAALELQQLALATADLPLPEPDAVVETAQLPVPVPEVRVETDPYDESLADADPWAELPWPAREPADPPEPPEPREPLPPDGQAAQDAASGTSDGRQDAQPWQELLLRCLRLPLPDPKTITLHIPMSTALDLDQTAGQLDGYGPIPAQRIRALTPVAGLRNLYIDADTGLPLWADRHTTPPTPLRDIPVAELERDRHERERLLDTLANADQVIVNHHAEPRHDPSRQLAELINLRDQKCSGPGCAMPAHRCDLDHETRWPEGPTAEWNLNAKSRRCHQAKHHGWTVERHDNGHTDWTSPTGRTYTTPSPWEHPPAVPDNTDEDDTDDEPEDHAETA
ncbi:MAG: endonuclease, partial [Frankiales bacterium]|nr:endonuclease [Frankiales bacterium]